MTFGALAAITAIVIGALVAFKIVVTIPVPILIGIFMILWGALHILDAIVWGAGGPTYRNRNSV